MWLVKIIPRTMMTLRTLFSHSFLAIGTRLAFQIAILGHCARFVNDILMVFGLRAEGTIFANLGCGEIAIDMTLLLHTFWTVETIGALFHIIDRFKLFWIQIYRS